MKDIDNIASNVRRLADWYKAYKPAVKHISINAKDAKKLRELWKNEDKRPEVAMAGFRVTDDGITWDSWELREPQSVE